MKRLGLISAQLFDAFFLKNKACLLAKGFLFGLGKDFLFVQFIHSVTTFVEKHDLFHHLCPAAAFLVLVCPTSRWLCDSDYNGKFCANLNVLLVLHDFSLTFSEQGRHHERPHVHYFSSVSFASPLPFPFASFGRDFIPNSTLANGAFFFRLRPKKSHKRFVRLRPKSPSPLPSPDVWWNVSPAEGRQRLHTHTLLLPTFRVSADVPTKHIRHRHGPYCSHFGSTLERYIAHACAGFISFLSSQKDHL